MNVNFIALQTALQHAESKEPVIRTKRDQFITLMICSRCGLAKNPESYAFCRRCIAYRAERAKDTFN